MSVAVSSGADESHVESLLSRIDAAERRARRRALVYTLLPIILTVALVAYATRRVVTAQATVNQLNAQARLSRETIDTYSRQLGEYRRQVTQTREALKSARSGINAFHQGQYGEAIRQYEQALESDPDNPYVLNLKGYALFKARRLEEAEAALQRSVEVDPGYAYGYFDLARVYCAGARFPEAADAARHALSIRPDLKTAMLQTDGEFTRLCRPILHELR